MSERYQITVLFHPPTPEEYNAEDVVVELATKSKHVIYDYNIADFVEGNDWFIAELVEKYYQNLDGFRKRCKIYFRPVFSPDQTMAQGVLELNLI